MPPPFLWAHRGASCCAPENTLAAFTLAVDNGADGLELDIHLSRDGVPVVIHDETLERTTDGCGPVAEMTLQQLQRLDAGS
ncbi:MAG: glycerophosphodiester phosphodiesterase, partial [Desulfuromonadales bacterium]|nr:glycerophosphodiester phosphodiesterase [Desulfuromonadales bacterium]